MKYTLASKCGSSKNPSGNSLLDFAFFLSADSDDESLAVLTVDPSSAKETSESSDSVRVVRVVTV